MRKLFNGWKGFGDYFGLGFSGTGFNHCIVDIADYDLHQAPTRSASFAGQAGLSHSLAYQNTPKRLLDRFPSQGPQVPPPVGNPEWSAPKVNRSTAGLWGVVAIRSGPTCPDTATKSQGNLFFYGGHNGGQETVCNSLSPL